MRFKSDLWVKAYIRRCGAEGVPAVVVRRGDADAGVIFVKVNRLDGTAMLFGPAAAGIASAAGDRLWAWIVDAAPEGDIDTRLARELRIDPDLWLVEIEDRLGRHFLEDWLQRS